MQIRWSRVWIPLCWFDRHTPARDDAKWDGKYYVAPCRYCGKEVVRRGRGLWKLVRGPLT